MSVFRVRARCGAFDRVFMTFVLLCIEPFLRPYDSRPSLRL